jgi:hypothetical protein
LNVEEVREYEILLLSLLIHKNLQYVGIMNGTVCLNLNKVELKS